MRPSFTLQQFTSLLRPTSAPSSSTSMLSASYPPMLVLPNRTLHAGKPGIPKIVIAGGLSAIFATLESVMAHGIEQHPRLTLINLPWWLEKAAQQHMKAHWGQSPNGIPKVARDCYGLLHPDKPAVQRLAWEEVLELRQFALYILTEIYHIPVIHGTPTIKRNEAGGFTIEVTHDNEETGELSSIQRIDVPENAFFYEKASRYGQAKQRVDSEDARNTVDDFFHSNTIVDLYALSEEQLQNIKTIIMLGSGESAVWIARDFPHIQIVIVRNPGALPPMNPDYQKEWLDKVIFLNKDEVSELSLNRDGTLSLHDITEDRVFSGIPIDATGQYPLSIAEGIVPDSQLFTFEPSTRVISAHTTPPGAFAPTLGAWMEGTGNSGTATHMSLQVYHRDTSPKVLRELATQFDLSLDDRFFTALETFYTGLTHDRSDEEMYAAYREIYVKTLADEPSSNDSANIEKFEQLLEAFRAARLDTVTILQQELARQQGLETHRVDDGSIPTSTSSSSTSGSSPRSPLIDYSIFHEPPRPNRVMEGSPPADDQPSAEPPKKGL